MKILHVLPALTKGGAEKVVVDLANRAARDGHEVAVLAAYPVEPLLQDSLDPRVSVSFVGKRRSRLGKFGRLAPWLAGNRRWLLSRDVVHCHLTFGAVVGTAVKLMRRGRRPVVVETYHAVGMPIPAANRAVAAMLASRRDGLVLMAEDEFWKRFRKQHPKLPVRVIPNGVALREDRPSRQAIAAYKTHIGVPPNVPVVGTVGRIVAGRMPLRMIEGFAEIARRCPEPVHFIMGGDGDLLEQSRDRARALGIADRVHFPGFVADQYLTFAAVDLYVSINVGAITGIAGLEAAGSGKPVIALQTRPDHRGHEDWIWSSPDPGEVAAEAARLLADPIARERLAERQQRQVREQHSDASMGSAYEAFYADCLSR